MKLWIVLSGQGALPPRCDSAAFDRACEDYLAGFEPPEGKKPMKLGTRRLLVSPRLAARQTAALLLPGAEAEIEPLLDEIPLRSSRDTARTLPLRLWLAMAARQRAFGLSRQPESRKAAADRADRLLDALEAVGRDSLLITHPLFAAVLLDRARLRSCTAQRSGLGSLKPWELILVSKRTEHCGGCQHNCLLSNPGCSIGRDKAARNSG